VCTTAHKQKAHALNRKSVWGCVWRGGYIYIKYAQLKHTRCSILCSMRCKIECAKLTDTEKNATLWNTLCQLTASTLVHNRNTHYNTHCNTRQRTHTNCCAQLLTVFNTLRRCIRPIGLPTTTHCSHCCNKHCCVLHSMNFNGVYAQSNYPQQHTATHLYNSHCYTLQATNCNDVHAPSTYTPKHAQQHTATHCCALLHTATHCSQDTATMCMSSNSMDICIYIYTYTYI